MVGASMYLGAVALAAVVGLVPGPGPSWAGDPTLLLTSEAPGPQVPPLGRSLFDELFAKGGDHEIPFPFERLLGAVNSRLAPARARTALIPIGRSLQRFAADPDYFGSPRLVVAVDREGTAGIDRPRLKDRLYLGYQPASETIEVISYNEAAARFEFQIVSGYGGAASPLVEYPERAICITCHQGHGPIFSRPLWSETNANPWIAERLAGLGTAFHGARVRQGVDGPDAFDRSTDRANRIALANRLWSEGCGEGRDGAACRAGLLRAALIYRLGGKRAVWLSLAQTQADFRGALQQRLSGLWPQGLGLPSPDLPNRNPAPDLAAGRALIDIPDALGPADPEAPRAPVLLWAQSGTADETYDALVREIARQLSPSDVAWLDRRLADLEAETSQRHSAPCRLGRVTRQAGVEELRFDCGQRGLGLALRGFVTIGGARTVGRIDELSLGQTAALQRLGVASVTARAGEAGETIEMTPRESGAGLSARLVSGERLAALTLRIGGAGEATAEALVVDDRSLLDRAIARLAEGAAESLGPGPLRRRMVLADLDRALAGP